MRIFIIWKGAFILQQARIQPCGFSKWSSKVHVYEDEYVHFKYILLSKKSLSV